MSQSPYSGLADSTGCWHAAVTDVLPGDGSPGQNHGFLLRPRPLLPLPSGKMPW